jgi:hypothetical protein
MYDDEFLHLSAATEPNLLTPGSELRCEGIPAKRRSAG